MAAQVEAKSLSAINHIAAHPPQYPINPIERHETLCLYISRVPGSRDVILSPFKPQQNSVGADDVANALYYIHLDTPSDEAMAASAKAQRYEAAGRGSMESTRTERKIVRKPLPATAKISQPTSPVDTINSSDKAKPAPSTVPGQNKENVPTTGDAHPAVVQPSDMPAPPIPAKVSTAAVPIISKPLGPRQMTSEQTSPPNDLPQPPAALRAPTPPSPSDPKVPLPHRRNQQPLNLGRASLDLPPTHHTPLASPTSPSRSPSPWSRHATHYSALPPPNNQKPFTPFSLTIIRRDPSTGHQWNIGKVNSFQSTLLYADPNNPDAAPVVQYPRGYPAINVHIETSGYARFRDFPVTANSGEGGGVAARDMKELAAQMIAGRQNKASSQQQGGIDDDSEGGFTRQVTMAYGKSWTSNLKEAFKGKGRERSSTTTSSDADHSDRAPLQPPRASFQHSRQDSGASTTSADSLEPPLAADYHHHHAETPQPVLHPPPAPGLRPKGYTFTSPWHGACDFRTTSNGRALKCRHTRNTTSQGFNPLVAAQALRDAASEAARGASGGGGNGGGNGAIGGRRARGLSASAGVSNTVPVSELRFNLPATDLFHSKEDRERAAREVKEGLGRLVRSPGGYDVAKYDEYGDEIEEEEAPVFDWSALGRERAGGGARGRKAKLGKLLIYDEGLKMLDLVVACNMGIWWQAWERNF
ncbi:hypothetical protein N0V82_005926 [Gnomoniopsis sp. IMI 355080]|nr:hypothetical protein N0V82_005926 [Gnomoniopsis sp. IMI 355080]